MANVSLCPCQLLLAAALLVLSLASSCAAKRLASDAAEPAHNDYPSNRSNSYPSRRYCSCASPVAVPLANGQSHITASAAYTSSFYHRGGNWKRPGKGNDLCRALPTAGPGGACGAALGVCSRGYCCSQAGLCSTDPVACDGGCQCEYSGVDSKCQGSFPFPAPDPLTLPVAVAGGPCGPYLAVCPSSECCSQFGFCVPDSSPYCGRPSCRSECSPKSKRCVAGSTKQNVVRHDWAITWQDRAPDGFTRPVIVVDEGRVLFPTVTANVGDRIIVTVNNKLDEPMSIHWHGMLQFKTMIMDGVTGVTQRPVMPGESYTYNFVADTAGTFWWHSHFKTQYMDGIWGALIVNDPSDPQKYPADEVVAFNDWYHEKSSDLLEAYLSADSGGDEPTPYTALLNGVGQGHCEVTGKAACGYAYVKGVAAYCDSPKTRLRLINAGGFAIFNVSIDNHRLIVVAEDAVEIEPVEVGSLQINNGQRYDVLVCQTPGSQLSTEPVWIRASMQDSDFPEPSKWNTSLGVLYFTDQMPTKLPKSKANFLPPRLDPSHAPDEPGVISPYLLKAYGNITPPPVTKTLRMIIGFYNEPRNDDDATQWAHFNGIALQLGDESPSLLERVSNNPANIPPPDNPARPPGGLGWHTIDIKRGEVVDLVIENRDGGEHPIHLHGHWFWVMKAGLPNAGRFKGSTPINATVVRDTITVNAKSYLQIRFVANNPGIWIMHCHIDWHVAAGLGLIFKEAFY